MPALERFTGIQRDLDTYNVFDDFTGDQVDTTMVDTVTDSGTVLFGDTACGIATLTCSDGSVVDNDEAYLTFPNETFLFAVGAPLYARARVKWTETSAGVHNIAFAFMNAMVADSIIDDGGGLNV